MLRFLVVLSSSITLLATLLGRQQTLVMPAQVAIQQVAVAVAPRPLVTWRGDAADPPADAVAVASSATTLRPLDDACISANACPLANGVSMDGYIQSSGQSNAYRFDVAGPSMHVTADLTNLPADYDLYLVDAAGTALDQSVHEDVAPEEIDTTLGPGTYYLFVHSDPGRPFDGDNPYTLHLSVLPTNAAGALP